MRSGLGSGYALDLGIDDDILAFPGDAEDLGDILGAVARDARLTMINGGGLQLCALNVFDRCGGDRDQVMIVLSYPTGRDDPPAIAIGSGLWRAMAFAAASEAECELLRDDRAGTSLCLVHPTVARRTHA